MSGFTHENPGGINDNQEKWLKIFTKRSFFACVAVLFPALGIFFSFKSSNPFVGATIAFILELITYGLTSFKMPEGFHLYGEGLTLDVLLFRIIVRRIKRVIYVKNYEARGGRR